MKILITGATGYIGKRLIPILLNETPLMVTVKPRAKPGPVAADPVVGEAGSTYSWSSIVALPKV